MPTEVNELYEFVLEKLPEASLAKRARLSRSLALIIGDEKTARALVSIAKGCEAIDRSHRQLVLDFQRTN